MHTWNKVWWFYSPVYVCVLVVFVPYGTLYHTYIHIPKLIHAHGHDVYIIEKLFLSNTTDLVGAPAINNTYKYFKCEALKKNENRKLCLRNKYFSFFGWNCCCCLTMNEKYMQNTFCGNHWCCCCCCRRCTILVIHFGFGFLLQNVQCLSIDNYSKD